jgi:hypothetical protein
MEGVRRAMTGALLVAALAGCAGSGGGKSAQGGGSGCVPPADPSISYANNIQPIYDISCAVAGCHLGAAPAFGLNLAAGVSYDATVEVKSLERPKLLLVEPGNPDDSYLVQKIEGAQGIAGGMMPANMPPLSLDEMTAIRQWVVECAPDN